MAEEYAVKIGVELDPDAKQKLQNQVDKIKVNTKINVSTDGASNSGDFYKSECTICIYAHKNV